MMLGRKLINGTAERPSGFGQNGHLPCQESLKDRHISALSFLAPGRSDSNLGGAVYEFTA